MFEILMVAAGVWILVRLIQSLEGPIFSKRAAHRPYVMQLHGVEGENEDGTWRQTIIANSLKGDAVTIVADPENLGNPEAVKIFVGDGQLGYIDAPPKLQKQMRSGIRFRGRIEEIYEFPAGSKHHGVAVRLERI